MASLPTLSGLSFLPAPLTFSLASTNRSRLRLCQTLGNINYFNWSEQSNSRTESVPHSTRGPSVLTVSNLSLQWRRSIQIHGVLYPTKPSLLDVMSSSGQATLSPLAS